MKIIQIYVFSLAVDTNFSGASLPDAFTTLTAEKRVQLYRSHLEVLVVKLVFVGYLLVFFVDLLVDFLVNITCNFGKIIFVFVRLLRFIESLAHSVVEIAFHCGTVCFFYRLLTNIIGNTAAVHSRRSRKLFIDLRLNIGTYSCFDLFLNICANSLVEALFYLGLRFVVCTLFEYRYNVGFPARFYSFHISFIERFGQLEIAVLEL